MKNLLIITESTSLSFNLNKHSIIMYRGITKEQLIEKKETLTREYIGVFDKPQSYFKEIEDIKLELTKREGYNK
jgi:hypothetical protein